jgi:ABC-type uncharacterized transport system ATPase subunit
VSGPGTAPLLSLRGIHKSFGAVRAVRGVDFDLAAGEVHALVGENGAGKSTLMHVACGMTTPDAGTIEVRGREVRLASPRDARGLGIGMVHQHFTSIEALTVAENIALATGPRARGVAAPAPAITERLMVGIDPAALVGGLTVAQRQRLEIVKALATGARVLLLDEPTAVLAPALAEELFGLIRSFAAEGGAVALITHKLREVMLAADRVTVLRRGAVTLREPIQVVTERILAEAMIGGELSPAERDPVAAPAAGSFRVTVRIGGIELHAGELIGLAAVEGNGQRRILRAVAGLEQHSGVEVIGRVGFVPEDRTTEGLIPELSLTENLVLGLSDDARWRRGPRIDWTAAGEQTARLIDRFGIVAPGPDAAIGILSGGNQQKLLLARALEGDPPILVLENPTRGLDVRTTGEVHRRLREAAAAGITILVYSSDLDEVIELADRVLVVWKGEVREAIDRSRPAVGAMMLGLPTDQR